MWHLRWSNDVRQPVSKPMTVSDTHFQKTTSSLFKCDLTFCLMSILNIWRVLLAIKARKLRLKPSEQEKHTFQSKNFGARIDNCTVCCDCRQRTLFASARSMMTTWFCSPPCSRTQMKWFRVPILLGEVLNPTASVTRDARTMRQLPMSRDEVPNPPDSSGNHTGSDNALNMNIL
jgi:hypothetical protein